MRTLKQGRSSTVVVAALAALTIAVLALAVAVAGCGDTTTTASPASSASPSQGTAAQKAMEYTAYYKEVQPVFADLTTAIGGLDGTVKGLSKKPDETWTQSAKQMQTSATQLGTAATELEAITPPAGLESAQASVITGLQSAQKILDDTAAYLDKRVADPSMPDVKTTIETEVKAKLTQTLHDAFNEIMTGMSGGSPMPSMAP
jgi:hypothetical protein